ncbi:9346_t:CDS:2, partial [Cetraspora pellucida]
DTLNHEITNKLIIIWSVDMSSLLKHIREKNVRKLAKKSETAVDKLPPMLQNRETATLVLKALKKDQYMPALVFDGMKQAAIISNLTTNGATNYNDVVFTFPNGNAIGAWTDQIRVNIPWALNQPGVPDVCTSVIRINRITERDTCTLSTAFDLENYSI